MTNLPAFALHPADGIDPASVPQRRLAGGGAIPAIGIGTFGNDRYSPAEIAGAVLGGISVGYRLIDCGAVYGNEPEVGQALAAAMTGGVPRHELFIGSKLWNGKHRPADVLPALRRTLADLGLDYLDIYYIHWPFPNTHAPGAAHEDRSPDAVPFSAEGYLATYRELEKALETGLIRHIGVSNMTVAKLEALWDRLRIKPVVNQVEMHPAFAQPRLFEYLRTKDVVSVAYCPMGSPGRPARDTEPEDVVVFDQPIIKTVAARLGAHPAEVCVRWAVTRGQVPIPSSVKRANYLANLRAATASPLPAEDMAELAKMDCDCRLIKGQVFLWPGAASWHDLWDEDGVIAG